MTRFSFVYKTIALAAVAGVTVLSGCALSGTDDSLSIPGEQSIKQLERMKRPKRDTLIPLRDELLADHASLSDAQIERLIAVALDTGKQEETRRAAIAVVLAAVQNRDFAPVQRLSDELRAQSLNERLKVESRNESQRLLQDGIVIALTRNEALQGIARSEAANRMLLGIATSRGLDAGLRLALEQWLTELNPDKTVGSANALSLVMARPDSIFGVNLPIIAALDDCAIAQLRTLVRETAASGKLHGGAASTLAHLGDESIQEVLRQYFTAANAAEANRTGGLIWKINVQKTNTGLLSYLATPTSPQDAEDEGARSWALNRAVERGIPKDDIRAALFKHAESVKPETRTIQATSKVPPKTITARYALFSIKCQALRLGIFTEADWPDIKCAVYDY